jgi:hypothetical protein
MARPLLCSPVGAHRMFVTETWIQYMFGSRDGSALNTRRLQEKAVFSELKMEDQIHRSKNSAEDDHDISVTSPSNGDDRGDEGRIRGKGGAPKLSRGSVGQSGKDYYSKNLHWSKAKQSEMERLRIEKEVCVNFHCVSLAYNDCFMWVPHSFAG